MQTIAFHTLGCKLNYSETSTISRMMEKEGLQKVDFTGLADVYLINTCSVTENADKECKMLVRQIRRKAPDAVVAITGCYAQLKPTEIANMDGVDMVLGAAEKFNLIHHLKSYVKTTKASIFSCQIEEVNQFTSSFSFGDRTRSFLKVQDGCNYNCSFCTIPMARGASRSDTIANAVAKANEIASLGVKEIVLTGVNLGDFESFENNEHYNFFDLIKQLDNVAGIERYRISSIEPNLLSHQIIEWVATSKKFMPHFHVPLQSGSNTILKAMRRRYLSNLYVEKVNAIKQAMPHACIGVDVIVGFPGETEAVFQETLQLLHQLEVSYLHVFTYSERPNTHAITLPGAVPIQVRKQRNSQLRLLSEKKMNYFRNQFINTSRPVLIESQNSNGQWEGFTDNYLKITTENITQENSIINLPIL
jgi:threonylcarbamoyladenosine tRNA methylthiotransferase MtaB